MPGKKKHSDDSFILRHSLIWDNDKPTTQTATDIWNESKSKKNSSNEQNQKGQ